MAKGPYDKSTPLPAPTGLKGGVTVAPKAKKSAPVKVGTKVAVRKSK